MAEGGNNTNKVPENKSEDGPDNIKQDGSKVEEKEEIGTF